MSNAAEGVESKKVTFLKSRNQKDNKTSKRPHHHQGSYRSASDDWTRYQGPIREYGKNPYSLQLLRAYSRPGSEATAKDTESSGNVLSCVDCRVLLEEQHVEGDDGEVALLPKSIEELLTELRRRRSRNNVVN